MLCFSIEGFVNHIGERIFKSWKSIERGMSPVGKLKLIMETLKIEPEYEKDPFNTVNQIMQWRNVVAHAKTEKWETEKIVRNETEAKMAQWLNERTDWQLFAIKLDLEKVGSTCTRLMQTIHEKAYGNMDGFLMATSEGSDTEEIEIDSIPK
jgi:hypothetical protein